MKPQRYWASKANTEIHKKKINKMKKTRKIL